MIKYIIVILYGFINVSFANAEMDNLETSPPNKKITIPGVTITSEGPSQTNTGEGKIGSQVIGTITGPDALLHEPANPMLRATTPIPRRSIATRNLKAHDVKAATSVGQIITDGIPQKKLDERWSCTAFCVAGNVIATSAHCLAKAKGGSLPSLDNITFRLRSYVLNGTNSSKVFFGPYESSKLQSVDEKNPHLSVYSGYDFKPQTVASAANDWALAKLTRPVCSGKSVSLHPMKDKELINAGKSGRLYMLAYDRWNGIEPLVSRGCKIFSRSNAKKFGRNLRRTLRRNKAILIHDCSGVNGSSGGPIFINVDGVPHVVAINRGGIKTERRIPIKRVRRGNKISITYKIIKQNIKTATHVGAIAKGLKRFREESILNSLEEFKEVQTYLKQSHLYRGKIDGLLGPGTKRALMRYEEKTGLVPIGLPTQRLLSILRKEFQTETVDRTANGQ